MPPESCYHLAEDEQGPAPAGFTWVFEMLSEGAPLLAAEPPPEQSDTASRWRAPTLYMLLGMLLLLIILSQLL